MGDAKRRKQLGLMPTVYPFEVLLDRQGELTEVQMPSGETERGQIVKTLEDTQASGPLWDQEYRTLYVSAGLPQERLITREDVEQIPVPPRRRLVGDLAIWPGDTHKPEAGELAVEGAANTWLRFRSTQHAFENQPWQKLEPPHNAEELLGYLFQHPAMQLKGDVVAEYTAEQSRSGELSWTPQPSDEQRAALDKVARAWHGETPEDWVEGHAERLSQEVAEVTAPQLLKTSFELREPAPLNSLFAAPFDQIGGLEVFPTPETQTYSLDGQTWEAYPVSEAEDGLDDDLGDFNDVETFSATVWRDGRMDWPKDALDAGSAAQLSEDLKAYTGAGEADDSDWKRYTDEALKSFFDLNDEQVAGLPTPQAIRISVPTEIYDDEDDSIGFEAKVIEDEISFDGQTWHDLYDELPENLLSATSQEN